MRIESWEDVDKALLEIGRVERAIVVLGVAAAEDEVAAKRRLVSALKPLEARRQDLVAHAEAFVREREGEMVGRTWKGAHGKVWLRKVTTLTARSWKRVLDWLLENKRMSFVRVKYQVNKETLGNATEDVLRAAGARLKDEDAFGYEVS